MDALQLRDAKRMPYLVKAVARILVIDDDACVSTAIQAILARHQYDTTLSSRAHAGMHALQASQFDVVMVDLFMPGMNGLDTITRIRSGSAVPIIAMSGFRLRNFAGSRAGFPRHGDAARRDNLLAQTVLAAAIGCGH
jgi:CheY-like chemotaxis protein